MYQSSYAETALDSQRDCRERERQALEHAIMLLQSAETGGLKSPAATKALDFLSSLWKAFIQDLLAPENDLPDALRADLVSVGVWVLKETESVRLGNSVGVGGLIEVCSIICDGLK